MCAGCDQFATKEEVRINFFHVLVECFKKICLEMPPSFPSGVSTSAKIVCLTKIHDSFTKKDTMVEMTVQNVDS